LAEVDVHGRRVLRRRELKSLRYASEGSGHTFGQAYLPTGAWPKVNYHSVLRTIDFDAAAMRDEIVLSRAEPRGGGYPISGQQRNNQFISGEIAWNVVGGNFAPGPRFVADRAQPNSMRPDRLALSGKAARLQAVAEKAVMADASRTIELHHIAGSQHAMGFLMVYLPKERLLIEADAFTPGPVNAPPPATANPNHLNLIDNLERLQLQVDRILPLHGRVMPLAELYRAAGRAPSR